ncbi:MAG: GyrI-like domain-containing protein [Lachnospiraceae bacterium]
MKHEWKKHEKTIYLPTTKPQKLVVPAYNFFTIEGQGNPNEQDFANRIAALYPLAYAIRMMPKSGDTPDGYFEYTVYPLEGIWSLSEKAIKGNYFSKEELVYKIMIRQPDFITPELFDKALAKVKSKKNVSDLIDEVKLESIQDGTCVQMMHIGSYDTEPESFDQLKQYCENHNFNRTDFRHREIYISDFRKTAPDKLKTVLRYFINE